MAKVVKNVEDVNKKWERVFEDEYSITIWRYDSKKSMINPYEVETKNKKTK
jgi:hypothetical protein